MIGKILLIIASLILISLLVAVFAFFILGQRDLPQGVGGSEAEALTRRIEQAVGLDSWKKTAAISFDFSRSGSRHFCDLKRGYWKVEWSKGGDSYRLLSDRFASFVAYKGQELITGEPARQSYFAAWKKHINDLFWFNPFVQLRSPGAERLYVGQQALLVTYHSGGVTPGDSYLIITDEKGLPQRWQIWASILPLKGLEFTFEDWRQSQTGAWLSLVHKGPLLSVNIEQVQTYPDYPIAGEVDHFLPLKQALEQGTALNAYSERVPAQ